MLYVKRASPVLIQVVLDLVQLCVVAVCVYASVCAVPPRIVCVYAGIFFQLESNIHVYSKQANGAKNNHQFTTVSRFTRSFIHSLTHT